MDMDFPPHVVTEKALHKALKNDEFLLFYQPKVDLASGVVTGAEALIRWEHPVEGIIPPGEFIPLTEESSLINEIGRWVLEKVCSQLNEWEGSELDTLTISVNLSVRQLNQPDFLDMMRSIVDKWSVNPEQLELEITESLMMDSEHAYTILRELKNMGVVISLDDFGKGYSSLHYLKKLPLDKIKIDQSFIKHCTHDLNDATIVKTMIVMAHQLNFQVVAEGVEKEEHVIFLQKNLCDEAQGYLFNPPMPASDFLKNVHYVNEILNEYGMPNDEHKKQWMEEEVRKARQEVLETVREQQGMTFKYVKRKGRFIHTLCDGELLYRMGLTPEQVVGRELKEFLPEELVVWKEKIITENISDLIKVVNAEGVVEYASPSHQEVLGYGAETYKGERIFNYIHPDDAEHVRYEFKQLLKTKKIRSTTYRHKHFDGHWVYVEAKGTPVMDEEQKITHAVVVARNKIAPE
ncbi:EAL domain-containing protein [Halobacillus sp. A5]|uniref:EAL domain-containing protein n=1 Tax=Halobacillus sp. A5 TaxID=2880263 RepID=UPI0020A6514A|nr:EAL domain-containing protein [Halobacillus sp. A5]MCP3027994.1 EAL domain-containing protein [Halobacillus sp. A5]